MTIIIKPSGDQNLSRAVEHAETGPPQTIPVPAGGGYELGRVVWFAETITVNEAALTRGDIPWTDVVQHMAMQFTSGSLQGKPEINIPIPFVAPDVPYGSANNWGAHKIVQTGGLTFDWEKWDNAVAEVTASGLSVLTVIPHTWPKGSVFVAPAYVPIASNWKQSIDAYLDQIVLRPGLDDIEYYRAANETISPKQDGGVFNNLWYEAASEDTEWTDEGLSPRMWWTYSAAKGARTFPSSRVFLNDYSVGDIDGSSMGWGQHPVPAEISHDDQMHQRFYIMLDQLHEAFALAELTGAGEVAGPGGLLEGLRIDGVGVQSHFKTVHGICESDIMWQLWEFSGALDLGIYLTEINTKVTDSGNLVDISTPSEAMDELAAQVTAVRLNIMLKYSKADNRMWTFWTKFTDDGDNQAITLFDAGARTVVYDKIRGLVNKPPTPLVKRGALTNFHASGRALLPIQPLDGDGNTARDPGGLVTTNISAGSYSNHASVGIQLLHSRYKKGSVA